MRQLFKSLVIIAVIVNLFAVGMKYIPFSDLKDCYFQTDALDFLGRDKDLYRIVRYEPRPPGDYSHILPCNTPMVYGISDVQGYACFLIRRYGEFMNLIEAGMFLNEVSDIRILQISNPNNLNSQLIDLANIKYVLTSQTIEGEKYQLVYDKELKIYQNRDYLPRAFIVPNLKIIKRKEERLKYMKGNEFRPSKEVVIEEPTPYCGYKTDTRFSYQLQVKTYESDQVEFKVNMTDNGWLVLADTYFPGWKVYIDEEKGKLYCANHCFRAVPLLKGEHNVKFIYVPFSFKIGFYLSLGTLVILLVLLAKCTLKHSLKIYKQN